MTITELANRIPELKFHTLSSGLKSYYIPLKFKQGQKLLLSYGFTMVINPCMLQYGKIYASYNSIMKVWLIGE